MADITNFDNGRIWLGQAEQHTTDHDIRLALAQMATGYATLAVADELRALRETIGGLREAVTDRDGFSSADHLRNINEWVERIAKA
ncbi:hypothetical protein AB0C42_33680 [Micromonospora taraxaci]|uniref:hypothetical protein n=1 Tax=Micromonospora taraxaci TaxID=1316803 RepID=UPI0033D66D06